ncbi:MAG: DNA replication and repair protein RecF, partial [Flavobacteriales bacterium]|nr:DNA replication and repair protein RecF [Flavobacteriales bacterium]
IKQRNELLKHFLLSNAFDNTTLSTYNELLVKYGSIIFSERKKYLEKFVPVFQKYYIEISSGKEKVDIEYKSQLNENDYLTQLNNSLKQDKISCRTSVGIHKDDLLFTLKGSSVKKYSSQGQQKSFLISLKLAQFDFLKEELGLKPILLLDDIFDKLDDKRVESLISLVKRGTFNQVFITDTSKERSEEILKKTSSEYSIFNIQN